MHGARKVRFIEPQGRSRRLMAAWIRRWPLLGPITLASLLHQRGYDAGVYNENISGALEDNPDALRDVCSANVVGISIMTPTASRGYELAGRIRREAPRATIVFGGPHATFVPHEAARYGNVVVRGEGETVIEAIAAGQVRQGVIRADPPANLDVIPRLEHRLMRNFDQLLRSCRGQEMYPLPVMASRGCPHGCVYCSVTRMFGRHVRRQSVDKVAADLEHYVRQGFRRFFFYDDNFTADRAWAKQLLERMRPWRCRFNAQTRADFPWAGPAPGAGHRPAAADAPGRRGRAVHRLRDHRRGHRRRLEQGLPRPRRPAAAALAGHQHPA